MNSTEKLLHIIRKTPPADTTHAGIPSATGQSVIFGKAKKKTLTAGVIIHDHYIASALIASDKSGTALVKWSYDAIPETVGITDAKFPAVLRNTIGEFLGPHRRVPVWTAVGTRNIKLRNLVVPDLPPAKTANAVRWSFKKEAGLEPDEEIFDFQEIGGIDVDGIRKKNILAFSAQKKVVRFLDKLFTSAGFPLTGITALPFAFQNVVKTDMFCLDESPLALVNISRYHSDIYCFLQSTVMLVRKIRTGAQSLCPPMDADNAGQQGITDILSPGLNTDSPGFKQMKEASERLIGKIIRTGEYCSHNIAANAPIARYLFYGETDNCDAFMALAASRIPGPVSMFHPLETLAGQNPDFPVPQGARERTGVIPACAIALSSNSMTPNFLHTYQDKAVQKKQKKRNIAVAVACFVCIAASLSGWAWATSTEKTHRERGARLEQQLAEYGNGVTRKTVLERIQAAQKRTERLKAYTRDYLSLGVINELCILTPENIKLTRLEGEFTEPGAETEASAANDLPPARQLRIEGLVKAGVTALEPTLTGYMLTLGDSPLFKSATLGCKQMKTRKNETVLTFKAVVEVI
ncbi:MAG: hypothetical protein V6Z89_02435 [Desulfobacter sp.]